jgi:anti-anti-sigma regulatory factor
MFFIEVDSPRNLLKITLTGHIDRQQAMAALEELRSLLPEPHPGLRLLTDLSGVESMSTASAPFLGQIMDLCTARGVETVARVLPADPRKDIGFAILSQFHYSAGVRITICQSLAEAEALLAE